MQVMNSETDGKAVGADAPAHTLSPLVHVAGFAV